MKRSEDLNVKIISAKNTQPLRHLVLWPHRKNVAACTIDIDIDPKTVHLGAFVNDQLVSIATFFKQDGERLHSQNMLFNNAYQLRAMATHPNFRRLGAGEAIILFALDHFKEKGADVIWCNARAVALGFYIQLGFEMIDEWFEIPIIGPHKLMYHRLK